MHLPPNDAALRELVCEMCRHLYHLGWASGTGGGFSIREGDLIYVAPSAVQKERITPEQIHVINRQGQVVSSGTGEHKISACTPLFLHAYTQRDAGAVLHSHSANACLASILWTGTFSVRGLEMMKGIEGGSADELLEVPILDNTPYEHELADTLLSAILAYPKTQAVLVRGHGVYVWGRNWAHAKTQAECYDYLFAQALRLRELGVDPSKLSRVATKGPT